VIARTPAGIARTVVVLLGAVALAGCARTPQAATSGDDWRVELTTEPQTVMALHRVVLRLRVTDRNGAALDITDLTADADMPEMSHGKTRISLRRTGVGAFEAGHTFSMDGRWEIHLGGRREGRPFAAVVALQVGR